LTVDPDLDAQARRLRYAATRLARLLRRQDASDLSPTQGAALASIERHGPITLGDLAAHEQVSAPTTTNVVSKLGERARPAPP
jgi:DNA-binding MarR family transcriptional regulator